MPPLLGLFLGLGLSAVSEIDHCGFDVDPLTDEKLHLEFQKMLKDDPKLAAEWRQKLEDPAFAADARARHRFFYTRTPYWDESVGLVPVFRLDAPLSPSGS